eukprot:CAMPEP_0167764782 /NCGR_PEP_ID=MMETSP0110_2-20121227/14259_1 /TAXON_ID=629695 /ORGANISM="Gymnochlora sp., Strain CCMP2014" /LENGTH=134 /DNA_ID=CAMNT_0007652295 /DNA_START=33 /DNA_END=437 /DNA_ORIENTATION=+
MQMPKAGKIETSKLGEALRSVGKRLTNDMIGKLKADADKTCNDGVDFKKFQDYVEQASKIEKTDEEIEKAFKVFDNGEKKGLINLATFKHSIMNLGDKLLKEQVEALFKAAKVDETKETVDYKVFMKLLQSDTA